MISEVLTVQRLTQGMGEDEMKKWMTARGYKNSVQNEILRLSGEIKAGRISLPSWARMMEDAVALEKKSAASSKRAEDLLADMKSMASELAQAEKEEEAMMPKLAEAEQEHMSWGWLPFKGTAEALQAVKEEVNQVKEKKDRLRREMDEAKAGAEVLKAAANVEMSEAKAMKQQAFLTSVKEEEAIREKLFIGAKAVIDEAEATCSSQGIEQAIKVLEKGSDALNALGLKPDLSSSSSSLAGRLTSLIAMSKKKTMKKSSPASASAPALQDDEMMSRGAFIGGLLLAAGGAAAYFATEGAKGQEKMKK